MGVIDWLLSKFEPMVTKARENREAQEKQQQAEKEAYQRAYSEARIKIAAREAVLDAEYGGHIKRVIATGLKNMKQKMEEGKKKRNKPSILNTPIKATVK